MSETNARAVVRHTSGRRVFHTLDAIRGVAALFIVTRHVNLLFGGVTFPESYLAVDLFFVMSGVVLAQSYEHRLHAGEFAWTFFLLRCIRLYPLYLVGIVSGLLFKLLVGSHAPGHAWIASDAAGFTLALFMLPALQFPPIDPVRWSLTFELLINAVYGFLFRWLTTETLIALIVCAAGGLVFAELQERTLDVGWQMYVLWGGLCRVTFSFFAGVFIVRRLSGPQRTSQAGAWLCVAAVAGLLAVTIPAPIKPVYEIAVVLLAFPLLVTVAMRFDVDPWTRRVFTFLGVTSYAVYILHVPFGAWFITILAHTEHNGPLWLWRTPEFFIFLLISSWALDRYYDEPVRAYLRNRLGSMRSQNRKPATPARIE